MGNIIKTIKLLVLPLLFSIQIQCQDYTVTGTVVDEFDKPIIGVTIVSPELKIYVVTDFDGQFVINVPQGKNALVFKYIGYPAQTSIVTTACELSIKLIQDPCEKYNLVPVLYIPLAFYNGFFFTNGNNTKGSNSNLKVHFSKTNTLDQGKQFSVLNEHPSIRLNSTGPLNTSIKVRGLSQQKITIGQIPFYIGRSQNFINDLNVSTLKNAAINNSPDVRSGMQLGSQINLEPKRYSNAISSSTQIGENNFFNLNNSIRLKNEYKGCYLGELSINHNLIQSDGDRENSGFKKQSITLNGLQKGPGPEKPWNIFVHMASVETKLPGPLTEDELNNESFKSNDDWTEIGAKDKHQTSMASISRKFGIGQTENFDNVDNSTSLFGIINTKELINPEHLLNKNTLVWGGATQFTLAKTYSPTRNPNNIESNLSFIGGLEYYNEAVDWKIYAPEDLDKSQKLNQNKESRSYLDLYLEGQYYHKRKFKISTGLNINNTIISSKDNFISDNVDYNNRKNFGFVLSPKIKLSYIFHPYQKQYSDFFIKAGHGLNRIPTGSISLPENSIRYLYDPERSWNYEMGFSGTNAQIFEKENIELEYVASIYSISRRDILNIDGLKDYNTNFNNGTANHTGIELYLKLIGRYTNWYASYNYNSTLYTDFYEKGINYSGNSIPLNIPHTFNSGMLFKSSAYKHDRNWFYLRLNFEYRSPTPLDNQNIGQSDHVQLFNAKLGYTFYFSSTVARYGGNKDLKRKNIIPIAKSVLLFDLHVGINNVFDTKYASDFVSQTDFQSINSNAIYYPGASRFIYLGANISINRNPFHKSY